MRLSRQQINLIATAVAAVVLLVGQGASGGAELPETAESQTAMAELAASMKPGQWAELKTSGLTMKVFSDGGHHALQYTDEAVWDPGSRQLFFCGEGHGAAPRFVKYTESTNRWTVLPLPGFGPVHAYDHQAIDPRSGIYYRGRYYSREIQQYNVSEGTWSKLTDIPAGSRLGGSRITFGFEYYPEMRGLVVFLSAGGLYFYDVPKNQWRQLAGKLGRYAYHEIARYNPVHKVVVFGGGNDSKGYRSKDLWKLDASGHITRLRKTPLPIGVTGTIFTVDPAGGKYLVFGRGKQVYEYDVTLDAWTELKGQQPPIFTFGPDLKGSAVFGCVATPVGSHGVVMFVKYNGDNSKVFLYKHAAAKPASLPYTTYTNFSQVLKGIDARYPAITRVSDPGTSGRPVYTGFFFYQCLQFDTTGRYLLGMRIHFEYRDIQPTDRGDIGFIDLKNHYRWTKIGETTAWSWQQGPRLQWRPASDEIVWNDRSDDGKSFVCRLYNFRTGKRRTLPRPIYDLSPDGGTALTHDFERMHSGTDYVGIEDKYKGQHAPSKTGVWKMDMDTGKAELIMPLDKMAAIAYPGGIPSSGHLYIFREGWNPSGTRFITFIKDPKNNLFEGYSLAANGTDVRYFYHNPSHHAWLDDEYIFDFGYHKPPGGGQALRGYFLFKDDGTGTAKELLWPVKVDDGWGGDGHGSFVPGTGNDWIISDTYSIHGFQYLFMYHRPSKLFVPLAKLKCNRRMDIGDGAHRVDLHPRLSRNGRLVSIDASHEGLGRQMYVIDVSHIVDNPPNRRTSAQ